MALKTKRLGGKRYACRASFLAVLGEVREAMGKGHNLRAIHAQNRERLSMSYRSFARYARVYLATGRVTVEVAAAPPAPPVMERRGTTANRPPGEPLKVTLAPAVLRLRDALGEADEKLI